MSLDTASNFGHDLVSGAEATGGGAAPAAATRPAPPPSESLESQSLESQSLESQSLESQSPLPAGGAGSQPPSDPGAPPADAFADDSLEAWSDDELEDDGGWFGDESAALLGSLIVHLAILLLLGLTPLLQDEEPAAVVIMASQPPEQVEELQVIEQVSYSVVPQDEVGALGMADFAMAEASAEQFAELAEIPSPMEIEPDRRGDLLINNLFNQPVAPLDKLSNQRGRVGQGVQGAAGAVDRLTFEILQSLEERPTLVVWLFDQSGSLLLQRNEIRDRFDKIYEELGVVSESRAKKLTRAERNKLPLLTSVIGFGQSVKLFTEEPTDDLEEIKGVIDSLPVDISGIERPFTAVELAADRFKTFRRSSSTVGPMRNVLLVVVTDERGDDIERLEPAVDACRRWGMPVYVIGSPAPFGQANTLVKYIDPDPQYDQTPQWAEVDQGPESLVPEQVRVGFSGNFQDEPVIDSGFGPYGLTRLAYETGGIIFTVHPNRNVNRDIRRSEIDPLSADIRRFFDPEVMARYRPDYLSPQDYEKRIKASPLRSALVSAAMQTAPTLERPRMRFVRRSEAELARDLTRSQQDAAKLEPALLRLVALLEPGLKVRQAEATPRWRAGYDLAMGRVLAQKVRTETYNAMLAKAKRGMPFADQKNNTWVLVADEEISVGSKWEREAALAKELLQEVVEQHPDTPWAYLASEELKVPLGWRWDETFTDLTPPAARTPGNNNNNNRPPQDDQRRMLAKPPTRPVPKL